MKTAYFHNFSSETFVGMWDGRKKTFKPGAKLLMPESLASHYATHLANRELIKLGEFTSTSPKKPDQVPKFKELFDKACIIDEDSYEEDENDMDIAVLNDPSNRRTAREETRGPGSEAQIIGGGDNDDNSFED